MVRHSPFGVLSWCTIFQNLISLDIGFLDCDYVPVGQEFVYWLTNDIATCSIYFAWCIVKHAEFMVNDGNYSVMLAQNQRIRMAIRYQYVSLVVHITYCSL